MAIVTRATGNQQQHAKNHTVKSHVWGVNPKTISYAYIIFKAGSSIRTNFHHSVVALISQFFHSHDCWHTTDDEMATIPYLYQT